MKEKPLIDMIKRCKEQNMGKEVEGAKGKSLLFAIRIVNLCKYLMESKKEAVLSKQILRSGTSIGANLAESECAISSDEFTQKFISR